MRIPASHADLVECPPVAALTTLMPDGSPHTSVVWCGADVHLDVLASKYARRPIRYFGDVVPADLATVEVPVLCRIRPVRVVAAAW